VSPELGRRVYTNSESIVGVSTRKLDQDFSKGLAITSSVHVDDTTHMEIVRYPKGSGAISTLAVYMTDGDKLSKRWGNFALNMVKHPIDFLRVKWPRHWAERTTILLAMQSEENYLSLEPKKLAGNVFLTTKLKKGNEIPSHIPIANQVTRDFAKRVDGIPQSSFNEVLLNSPVTAHILGGATMGRDPEVSMIDPFCKVHGYDNMYICDGSMVPGNLGVNPSLTISALTEHAMSNIPAKAETEEKVPQSIFV